MAGPELPKLKTWVRFPSPAPRLRTPAMSPTARRLLAWLVLLALALSSAAPSFASRTSAADLAALGICSLAAHEAQHGNPGQPPQDGPGSLASDLHHCALC